MPAPLAGVARCLAPRATLPYTGPRLTAKAPSGRPEEAAFARGPALAEPLALAARSHEGGPPPPLTRKASKREATSHVARGSPLWLSGENALRGMKRRLRAKVSESSRAWHIPHGRGAGKLARPRDAITAGRGRYVSVGGSPRWGERPSLCRRAWPRHRGATAPSPSG